MLTNHTRKLGRQNNLALVIIWLLEEYNNICNLLHSSPTCSLEIRSRSLTQINMTSLISVRITIMHSSEISTHTPQTILHNDTQHLAQRYTASYTLTTLMFLPQTTERRCTGLPYMFAIRLSHCEASTTLV